MINKSSFWFYFSECIAIIIIISSVSLFYLNQSAIGFFFNSDTLCISDLIRDITNTGYFKDWTIPTTAMFFPDWFVFFISLAVTKDIYYQLMVTAILNTLLLYGLLRLIYQQFFSNYEAFIFALVSTGLFLFLAMKILEPYVFLFAMGEHVGGFLAGLLYLIIQMKLISIDEINKSSVLLFFAVLISLAMGLSDLLFIIQFSLPIFLTYFYLYLKKKFNLKTVIIFSLLPLCFAVFGGLLIPYVIKRSLLYDYLDHPSLNKISLNIIRINGLYILHSFRSLSKFYWPIILSVGFYLIILYEILNNKKLKNKIYITLNKKRLFFNCFLIMCIILTIFSFILVKINPVVRYLEPLFFFPILFFFYKIGILNYKKIYVIKALAILIIIIILLSSAWLINNNFFYIKKRYYPSEIACIDQALKNYGHRGIAHYWIARPFTMLSRIGLKFNAVLSNLSPFVWATNINRFRNNYSFAIIDLNPFALSTGALDETLIRNTNGPPEKTITCGYYKLIIYPKKNLKIPFFQKKGDQFKWYAGNLPSQFPDSSRTADYKRRTKPNEAPGYLSFGPYINLTRGHYHFSINYKSGALTTQQAGFSDIFTNRSGLLTFIPMYGTKNIAKQIEGTFYVNDSQSNKDLFEIRVFSLGKKEFSLDNIQLIKD